MNKKNKNKNRSKPANPVPPPQKTEAAQIVEEPIPVLAEEIPISLIKESDSVTETTSEAPELIEGNDLPTDTPKKPKRNKGKKKKQEETNIDESTSTFIQNSEYIPPLCAPRGSGSEVTVQAESKVEAIETKIEEEDKNVEENITANVRKKKNKKKPNEQQKVEDSPQKIDYIEKTVEDLKKEDIIADVTTKSDVNISEQIESDIKQPKKKNKKKKHRRDSEKSENTDEVVICTAAFQKLISSSDTDKDPETNIESYKDSSDGDKNVSTIVKAESLKDLIESVLLPEESKQLEDERLESDQINEAKSKKKGKKDKKVQQPKKNIDKSVPKEEQGKQHEHAEESSNIVQELPSIEQVKCAIEQDTIPKAKAKIAKPVEKKEKRKGKIEISEGYENKLQDDIMAGELINQETVLETEKISENVCTTDASPDINVKKIDETTETGRTNENQGIAKISDKSSETLILSDVISTPSDALIVATDLKLADMYIGNKSNDEIIESPAVIPDPVVIKSNQDLESNSSKPLISLETPKKKDTDTHISSDPYQAVEKKKKKHPKKIDVTREKTPETKVLVTPDSESIKEEIQQKHTKDVISDLSTSGDLEISSLKADELDVSTDATPDFIHHPLATSQQLIDDNNNTIISEITSTDEILDLHLLIPTEPIIQDSGETPEPVGENIPKNTSSIFSIREKSVTSELEKTDLKSKMMEVSQDMEELRLSIERSLAELTSMERSEQDVVKSSDITTASQLITETESIPRAVKDDTSEVSKSLSVVKSSEITTASQHITETESIPGVVKDDTSEESKSLSENILGGVTLQETFHPSKVTVRTAEPASKKKDIITKPQDIQENVEMLALEKSDELKHVVLKETPPQVPARKDHKGKGKGKRKGKQETQSQQTTTTTATATVIASENTSKEVKKEEKEQSEQKSQSSESNQNKGKQQAMSLETDCNECEQTDSTSNTVELSFEPIEHFEDALTSSIDDVNKTFDMIANEVNDTPEIKLQNPQINISAPIEDTEKSETKQNPVSPPKNLLGHPDIPVQSNRTDYKKEKNKPPNMRQAKVKIKDAVDIEKTEKTKQSKESQTENKRKTVNNKNALESFSYMTNDDTEYVYKYSFRKVFLQSLCHVCRKELGQRVPCQFCSLVFYCSQKHKDEDWPQHQTLCFAICTIAHLKDQKHIYADARNITGQNYRLLRMQMIISCEKVLKRRLVPWEQEALLYPRICADVACREWKQSKLIDCEGCGQISYCSEHPEHLPSSHQRWCKSYALYQKLVHHQQTKGRLEPKLPTRLVAEGFRVPEKINEVLAVMYDEKIDMTDMEYAALTQLATAPLTAAYCHQLATANHSNGISKKISFVVHIVGAELQFEADVLFKWEVFFLHLKPNVKELRVVLISPDLNPSNLPLDLLGKVNLCESCRAEDRRILFSFQDRKTYYEYWASDEFLSPDIVCAFNPSIQRSSMYNGKDTWPTAVSCILKLKTPLVVSSYSINELNRDLVRIKECSELSGISFKTISEPKCNPFASVRPDRNFITDDEVPLLFKNYCFTILCGI